MGTTSAVHRMETEDLVCAAARFASGAVGVIEATTAAYPGAPAAYRTRWHLGYRLHSPAPRSALPTTMDDSEEVAADAAAGGTGADPMAFAHDYHLGVWRDFLAAVGGATAAARVGTRGAERCIG